MTEPGLLTALTIATALVFGMLPALPGGIRGLLAERFGTKPENGRFLPAILTIWMAVLMPLAGLLADHWGLPGILVAGSLAAAVGAAGLAVGRTLARAGAAMLLLGAGSACLGVGACVLMARAFYPDNAVAGAQIGTFFLAVGALIGPPLAAQMIRQAGFRRGQLVVALAALVPGCLAALSGSASAPLPAEGHDIALSSPTLWLAGGFFLLYSPLQGALAKLSPAYLLHSGHTPALASALTTGFWVSFLLTRLATGIVLGQTLFVFVDPEPWTVLLLALFLTILLGNMTATDRPRGAGFGLLLAGVTLAPMMPLVLGMVLRLFPHAQGTATGVVWAMGLLGTLGLSLAFPKYGRGPEGRDPLRLTLAPALLLAVIALVMALVRGLE
jgi:fucose permease